MQLTRTAITALCGLAIGFPLLAQEHQHQRPSKDTTMAAMHCGGGMAMMHGAAGQHAMPMMHGDSAMAGMMAMMGPPSPAMLLARRSALGLTTQQVSRLEALQKDAQPACTEHMRLGMAALQGAGQLLDVETPDWAAYSAKLNEATAHMAEGHVVMAKAAVAARGVLTPAQRQSLTGHMPMHRKP